MIPGEIEGFNVVAREPDGWDAARDGECNALKIKVTKTLDGNVLTCESAWVPSAEELATLAAGGHVVLRVFGMQVPVALDVVCAPDDGAHTPLSYEEAFFDICRVLDIPAMPVPPLQAYRDVVRPKIEALVSTAGPDPLAAVARLEKYCIDLRDVLSRVCGSLIYHLDPLSREKWADYPAESLLGEAHRIYARADFSLTAPGSAGT